MNLYERLDIALCTSGINLLLESRDTVLMLDLDNTLIVQLVYEIYNGVPRELYDRVVQNNPDLSGIQPTNEIPIGKFLAALKKYRYRDNIKIVEMGRGPALIITRPEVDEFLKSLSKLQNAGRIKEIVVNSANYPEDSLAFMNAIDRFGVIRRVITNRKKEKINPDWMMVDDSAGELKVDALNIAAGKPGRTIGYDRIIKITPFYGDLRDTVLSSIVSEIEDKL